MASFRIVVENVHTHTHTQIREVKQPKWNLNTIFLLIFNSNIHLTFQWNVKIVGRKIEKKHTHTLKWRKTNWNEMKWRWVSKCVHLKIVLEMNKSQSQLDYPVCVIGLRNEVSETWNVCNVPKPSPDQKKHPIGLNGARFNDGRIDDVKNEMHSMTAQWMKVFSC